MGIKWGLMGINVCLPIIKIADIIKTVHYSKYMHNKNLKRIHCCKCNGYWNRLTCLPATRAQPFSHFMVTGFWEVEPWRISNTGLPRMVLPKLLFPVPAQPSNTSLSSHSKTHIETFRIFAFYLVPVSGLKNKKSVQQKQDLQFRGISCWNKLLFYVLISAALSYFSTLANANIREFNVWKCTKCMI